MRLHLTLASTSDTAEILWPGRTRRSAASRAVCAALMTSAALPVTGAAMSAWTTKLVAWLAIQPSTWAPRSLRPEVEQLMGFMLSRRASEEHPTRL